MLNAVRGVTYLEAFSHSSPSPAKTPKGNEWRNLYPTLEMFRMVPVSLTSEGASVTMGGTNGTITPTFGANGWESLTLCSPSNAPQKCCGEQRSRARVPQLRRRSQRTRSSIYTPGMQCYASSSSQNIWSMAYFSLSVYFAIVLRPQMHFQKISILIESVLLML